MSNKIMLEQIDIGSNINVVNTLIQNLIEKDKISFNLPRKKASEEDLEKILSLLKGKIVLEKKEPEKPKEPIKISKKQERMP